jgi:hypothetical protein
MPSPGVLRPPTSPARGEGKLLRSRKRLRARVMPSRQEAKAAKPIQTRALSDNSAGRSHQRPPGWIALPFTDPLLYPPPLAGEEGGGAPTTNKEKREAERRQTRSQRPHPAGRGARPAGRARLSAFHRGASGGDRTPPLNSSHALPATVLGRCGRYPLPAVMQCSELLADRSSCRSGVFTQSRPGVAVTSRHPREPHSLHRSASPATSLTRARFRLLS